jgi:polysaccharide pyruvyl transferase WcaK-like protein
VASPLKVSLLGWYGHKNLGDDAMLEGLQYLFNSHFQCPIDFEVMSNQDTPTVPKFSAELANNSDLFVLGGGELIYNDWLWLSVRDWEKEIRVPKAIMGCGLCSGSISDRMRKTLRGFDYVGLRDERSFSVVSEDREIRSRVHLSLDPSLVLASKYHIAASPGDGICSVVATDREDRHADEGITCTNVCAQTKDKLREELRSDGMRTVRLLAFGGEDNDDLDTCRRLASFLEPEFQVDVLKPRTVKEALGLLAESRKVYAYRLHGMLFAYSLQIPFRYYQYHSKIKRNYDTITKLTLEQAFNQIEETWSGLPRLIAM